LLVISEHNPINFACFANQPISDVDSRFEKLPGKLLRRVYGRLTCRLYWAAS